MTRNGGEGGGPKRRTLLKGVAVAGVGTAIGPGTGAVSGSDHNPESRCDCPGEFSKYNFDGCEFVHDDNGSVGDIIEITYTGDDAEQNKEDEECEPIAFDYSPREGWNVTKVCVEGGPPSTRNEESVTVGPSDTDKFESDLSTNDTVHAISNVVFCVESEAFTGYQIDLIKGDVIETLDPDNNRTYCSEGRLLEAKWQDGRFDVTCGRCYDGDCDVIDQSITVDVENETATACIDPDVASDYALVVYGTPVTSWDPDRASEQEIYASDESPIDGCFEVELPPLESS